MASMATHKDAQHKPCPKCGGKDRFYLVLKPRSGSKPYWKCRQCDHWEPEGWEPKEAAPIDGPMTPERYAAAHGCTWQDFERAGCTWVRHRWKGQEYDAIRFPEGVGGRFRLFESPDKWVPEYSGQEPVLWGLSGAVNLATRADLPLLLVNGHSSVIACQVRGLPAFAVPGGEGNIATYLQRGLLDQMTAVWGGGVVVMLDGDEQGRKSTLKVVTVLTMAGIAVRMIDPGNGMDAADWARLHDTDGAVCLKELFAEPAHTPVKPNWLQEGVTLRDLQNTEFTPMTWVIDGLLPEGCCILAGKPKSKKSWLALGVSLACVLGSKAMGKLDVSPGRVLYLDLESNQRRMKSRAQAMLSIAQWPDNFTIFTKWPKGKEAIAQLDEWMVHYPDTRLIVIDVFKKIRPPTDKNKNPYDADYEDIQPVNEFAERHRVTVIVIHHTRKAKADDVFDEISGSTGLTGGTATMWIIGRVPGEEDSSVLHVRGRDVDDEELALKWDDFACAHVIEGDAALYAQSKERQQILDAMEDGKQHKPSEIAAIIQKPVSAVKFLLRRLLEENLISKAAYGKYEKIPQKKTYSAHSAISPSSAHSAYSSERADQKSERSSLKSKGLGLRVSPPPYSSGSLPDASNNPKNSKSEQSKGSFQSEEKELKNASKGSEGSDTPADPAEPAAVPLARITPDTVAVDASRMQELVDTGMSKAAAQRQAVAEARAAEAPPTTPAARWLAGLAPARRAQFAAHRDDTGWIAARMPDDQGFTADDVRQALA